jgi:hypothetical protein
MIAAERKPEVQEILRKRLGVLEAYVRHCEEMKKKGLIWEDREEWEFYE